MSVSKIIFSILNEIERDKDLRSTPSSGRKGAFKRGWLDAVSKGKEYKEATLDRLTWQNLGYRIGELIKESSVELIDEYYEFLERYYHDSKRRLEAQVELSDSDIELVGYEGAVKEQLRKHKIRERDNSFIRKFKEKNKGIKSCQACNFDPLKKYAIEAIEFLEVHHIIPLKERESKSNTITHESDLVLLCPNCHRAVHKSMSQRDDKSISLEGLIEAIDTN